MDRNTQLSARAHGLSPRVRPNDSSIVASLADEFFRRGVADYIGTAWEVAELPASIFATVLYKTFFARWTTRTAASAVSLGQAVQLARKELFERRGEFSASPTVWAAYQHYGDPMRTLVDYRA